MTVAFRYEDRPDHFSEYRAGFEIRTIRRCTAIEITSALNTDHLARTYHLVYLDQRTDIPPEQRALAINGASLLSQVLVKGHQWYAVGVAAAGRVPGYARFEPQGRRFFPVAGAEQPSGSLARPEYELADLLGNGLPDVLEMDGTVRYWRNEGNGRFDLPREMPGRPCRSETA